MDVLRDIPEESAKYYSMVPLGRREGFIDVGLLTPENVSAQEALKFISARAGIPVRIFVITPSDLQTILEEYRSLSSEVTKALGEFEKTYESGDTKVVQKEELSSKMVAEAPVTKMVAVILRHAVEERLRYSCRAAPR